MKKNLLLFAFSALFLGSLVSCKKDDDKDTTPTATPTPAPVNPLITTKGKGTADITVDGVKGSMSTEEMVDHFFTIRGMGLSTSMIMISGETKLPAASKSFTIKADLNTLLSPEEIYLTYVDVFNSRELHAVSGNVSYTITTTEKTVKFDDILFKTTDGAYSNKISFEVKLK